MPAVKEAKGIKAQAPAADVHHMLRTISYSGDETVDGARSVDAVDADVRTWLEAGYDLFATHYAGEIPSGIRILYIFVKHE